MWRVARIVYAAFLALACTKHKKENNRTFKMSRYYYMKTNNKSRIDALISERQFPLTRSTVQLCPKVDLPLEEELKLIFSA